MARLTQVPLAGAAMRSQPESVLDLARLLARLQQTILMADAERERRLKTSEYERHKAGTNLAYARNLLTRLEQDATGIKIQTRRQETQLELNRMREAHDQILERLRELEELSTPSDDEDDDSEGEDLLGGVVIPTPSESNESLQKEEYANDNDDDGDDDIGGWGEDDDAGHDEDDGHPTNTANTDPTSIATSTTAAATTSSIPAATTTTTTTSPPAPTTTTTTSQTLRPRHAAPPASPQPNPTTPQSQTAATSTAITSSSDANANPTATARAQLLGGARTRDQHEKKNDTTTTTTTTEAILDRHRLEQDSLTASLVEMASKLKESSQAFSTSLEEEKNILDAAGSGLAKNEQGVEAAARRMTGLRAMSEGKGWWGRVMLYAWIAGLGVLAILVVFVGPKFRF